MPILRLPTRGHLVPARRSGCLVRALVIRFLSISAVGVLLAGPLADGAQAQDRVRPFTKVEGWRISTMMQNGRASGCVAVSNYVDGTTFIIGYGARWWLGLNNAAWRGQGTRALQVQILVDGQSVHQAAAVQKERLVVMEFGESRDRIVALMAGQTITFVTSMGRSSFSLRGSAKATSAIADCVKARGNAPVAGGSGGGAFGSDGAGGGKATARAGQRRIADRAQTLELATTYLGKLGTPYTVLSGDANLLKNFPVNWKFPDGGFGGMVIYTGPNADVQKFFDEFVADNARLCKGTSGLERQTPATSDKQITRYSAIGTCQEAERSYLTDFTVLAGRDLLVAIVNIGAAGGEGTQQRQEQNKKWSL